MGKKSKAQEANERRQFMNERRYQQEELQRKKTRNTWILSIIAVLAVLAVVLVIVLVTRSDELDLDDFEITNEVTDYVRMNVTYVDQNGKQQTGDIIVELDAEVAPITVANFQKLVGEKFYDGLTFHRVMEGFMIQGGDPKGNGQGGSTTIKGEFAANGWNNTISHKRGVISMARRGDSYDSGSCQFFIVHDDSAASSLDGKYAAFGQVVYGMDTVDGIANTAVTYNSSGEKSSPLNTVKINYIRFVALKD